MVAYNIWDVGARFKSDVFYYGEMAELEDAEELIIKSFVRYFSAINKNGLKILRLFKHVGSNPTLITVCVADLVMHRIVVPAYVGSNPIVHLKSN